MIDISDSDRIRVIRLNRPEAKNAMNEALWDATTEVLIAADDDPDIAVVVLTGTGDAFSAGQDVIEMAQQVSGDFQRGEHGFVGLCRELGEFSKPLILAVNGMGLGFGATVLGFADLVFMSTAARLKCPFTSLGVAPELASSYTFPQLIGRQNATWALLSSEWLSAEECFGMGLVFKLCEPDELMDTTLRHAAVLASKPISSLRESKRVIVDATRDQIAAARAREDDAFKRLLGGPANIEAMTAFAEKRPPNFADID